MRIDTSNKIDLVLILESVNNYQHVWEPGCGLGQRTQHVQFYAFQSPRGRKQLHLIFLSLGSDLVTVTFSTVSYCHGDVHGHRRQVIRLSEYIVHPFFYLAVPPSFRSVETLISVV